MNYVKLNLGGKERGAKLGIGYLKHVTREKNISLDELFKSLEKTGMDALFVVPELIYLSMSYNCIRGQETVDFIIDDVFDWIDEDGGANSPVLAQFMEALVSSLGADLGKKQPQKKVVKK